MDASTITPPHEVRDTAKLAALVASMETNGWQGRPLLAAEIPCGLLGLTGSHRTVAARTAEIDVPVVVVGPAAWAALCAEDPSIEATLERLGGINQDSVLSAARWAWENAEEGSEIEAQLALAIELLEAEEEANLDG